MATTVIIILIVVLAVLIAVLAVLAVRYGAMRQEQRHLRDDLERGQQRTLEQRDAFKALAGDVLEESNKRFLQLAGEQFKGEQTEATKQLELRKQAVEAMVKPLRETLDKYNSAVNDVEKSRKEAYGALRTQLGALVNDQKGLKEETANLVKALRRPEVRGRWGEMQLKRVAELAGMIERCDFDEQVSVKAGSGALRPDMVVRLPNDRTIVVDAKTPLDAYLSSIEASDEDERRKFLETHANQIVSKVAGLSGKQYSQQFERSPDFVVLFIPGESFLYAAVQIKPDLLEHAMEKNVVIATPGTLISLLKAVALGWREEQITKNAQEISQLGQELHKRLCDAVEHVQKVGSSLGTAVRAYNDFLGSLERRAIVSARKLEELGAESNKALPQKIDTIDTMPREVKDASGENDAKA